MGDSTGPAAMNAEQKRAANRRLGLILASVAIALFIGFMVKTALFAY